MSEALKGEVFERYSLQLTEPVVDERTRQEAIVLVRKVGLLFDDLSAGNVYIPDRGTANFLLTCLSVVDTLVSRACEKKDDLGLREEAAQSRLNLAPFILAA